MQNKFIVSNYGNISEISKLVESKNNRLINKYIENELIIEANFRGIFNYIKTIKINSLNFLFLDSPYSYINIFFILVSKNFIFRLLNIKVKIFFSSRGSIPVKGCKKYFQKILYWKLLNLLNNFFNFLIISSSIYEKETLKNFFSGKINSIPDIYLCNRYFEENFRKIKEVLKKDSYIKSPSDNEIKVLIPSRFSPEKGVINLLRLINNSKLIAVEITSFDFTCNINDIKKINDFNIENKSPINLIGWQKGNKFLELLNSYDVVIIPSLYESFSIAGYQSLLMGKGLIITENSPWDRIVRMDNSLPISICKPLLRDYTLKKLIKEINNVNEKRNGFISRKVLDDLILKEAGM